ncbi:MAG: MBL fold metallo-hydrolase [Candidatus Bathyarchaeota archaeon]|nr:MBL fold metallo-hydrolase [Candidatus Bathyarchaeota archaeon]
MSIQKTPQKNEILFAWFNRYAGVTIKTPKKTLVIDPVDVKSKTFTDLDAILITHEHYDHLDQALTAEIQKLTQCKVIADTTSAKRLKNTIPQHKLQEATVGTEIELDDLKIRAEKCNHPPATTPITYLITSEDGVKIFHTADSLPYPEMAAIGEKEKPDIVFCTVAIAPGTSPETGVEIARLTKPKVAVPYHTGSHTDQKRFSELLKKELPKTTCLIPELGKIYQVSKRA